MAKVKVGFRLLYLASGCQISDGRELKHKFDFDGFEVNLYIGNRPSLSIVDASKDVIHFDPFKSNSEARKIAFLPSDQTQYKDSYFTEAFVVKSVEVPDDLLIGLNEAASEPKSRSQILAFVNAKYRQGFEDIASFFIGMIGLRYHFQFVITHLNEHFWLWNDITNDWKIESLSTGVVRLLEPITLNEYGLNHIQQFKMRPEATAKMIRSASISFKFLIKAWSEYDSVDKFIYLYSALEVAIKSGKYPSKFKPREELMKLQDLISGMEDSRDKNDLHKYIDQLSQKKSISELFVDFADHANFETCEDDKTAFKLFNKARNDLIHGGTHENLHSVKLASGKEVAFESFVERYVNWAYFEDTSIYPSRYRPDRPVVRTSGVTQQIKLS